LKTKILYNRGTLQRILFFNQRPTRRKRRIRDRKKRNDSNTYYRKKI